MGRSTQRVTDLVIATYADVFGVRPGNLAEAALEEDEDGNVQELLQRICGALEIDELDDDVAENLEQLVDFLVRRLDDAND